MKTIRAFVSSQSAATSIEYAIIASGVALVIVAAVNGLGTTVNGMFTSVQVALK